MHLLYVDDSGSIGNASEKYFILGGVAVFERGVYHIIRALDDVVAAFGIGGSPLDIELHGTEMYGGRAEPWRSIKNKPEREAMINRALAVIATQRSAVSLFGIAIEKTHVAPRDAVEYAFEEICSRFNLFLRRSNNRAAKSGDAQRGLVIMDEMRHEQPLQALARHFRVNGGVRCKILRKFRCSLTQGPLVSFSWPIWWPMRCGENTSTKTAAFLIRSSLILIKRAGSSTAYYI
jgi:hypothetical protein